MDIEKQKMRGGYVLFKIRGHLIQKTGLNFVKPILREIASGESVKIGVDMSRVGHIDSFGIGCILQCGNAMAERRGIVGEIVFLMTERLKKRLSVVGLDRLLKIEVVPDPPEEPQSVESSPSGK